MPARVSQLVTEQHRSQLKFMSFVDQCTNELRSAIDLDSRRVLILSPILFTKQKNNPDRFHSILADISRYKPEAIVLLNWPEPHWITEHSNILESIIKPLGVPYYLMGYHKHPQSTFFDFWAMCFAHYLPKYTDSELLPDARPSKLFLNHNRSNRNHRRELYDKLDQAGLIEFGHISLHDHQSPKLIAELLPTGPELWPKRSDTEDNPLFNVPNDPYTLGDLQIWRDHVLTIVSDGWWVEKPDPLGAVFLTEKVYKPIVGLRPFLFNGSYDNLEALKQQGFDIFEDVFEFQLSDFANKEQAHKVIVSNIEQLSKLTPEQLLEWYQQLMPRLLANKQHFANYVSKQQHVLRNYANQIAVA